MQLHSQHDLNIMHLIQNLNLNIIIILVRLFKKLYFASELQVTRTGDMKVLH